MLSISKCTPAKTELGLVMMIYPPVYINESNPKAYFMFSYHFKGLGAAGDEFSMLRLIFECCFLTVLGLDRELIKKMIKRNFTYQHFRSRVTEIKRRLVSQ
jgi:hypothetical protein